LDDYYESVVAGQRRAVQTESLPQGDDSALKKPDRKEQRRQAAERRARLAPLKKATALAEAELERLQKEKEAIERTLADPATYENAADTVADLTRQQQVLENAIERAEAKWLEAEAALEQALSLEKETDET
jgi:ATP-binding cassette subfamily F protein 3